MIENYFIYIDEHTILAYDGEPLKYYLGGRLVKIVTNPTVAELVAFGYKPLIEEEIPTYDEETEYLEVTYINEVDRIVKHYEVKPIPQPEPEENIEEEIEE